MRRPRSAFDWTAVTAAVVIALIGLGVFVWVPFYLTADCDSLDWMPVRELPARCLR